MNPEKPPIETEQGEFSSALENIDEWIEEQNRNKQAGRIDINLEYLIEIVSDFLSATRNMRILETDEEKKLALSTIEIKSKETLDGLGLISDLFEQADLYIEAKRRLLEAHVEAKKLFP